jgi:hypothetical protein
LKPSAAIKASLKTTVSSELETEFSIAIELPTLVRSYGSKASAITAAAVVSTLA